MQGSIEDRVVRVIQEESGKVNIKMFHRLVDDLDFDSLDLISLASAIEKEFKVLIPIDRLESISTPRDVVTYLETI